MSLVSEQPESRLLAATIFTNIMYDTPALDPCGGSGIVASEPVATLRSMQYPERLLPGSLKDETLFVRWAIAEGTSMIGSSVSIVVLPVLVYELSGSSSLTGLVFATRLVPYMLFGLITGPVADRSNRRWLIIGGNVIEGLLAATIWSNLHRLDEIVVAVEPHPIRRIRREHANERGCLERCRRQ